MGNEYTAGWAEGGKKRDRVDHFAGEKLPTTDVEAALPHSLTSYAIVAWSELVVQPNSLTENKESSVMPHLHEICMHPSPSMGVSR